MSRRRKKQAIANVKPSSAPAPQHWYQRAWVWAAAALGFIGWMLINGPTAIDNSQILPSKVGSTYNKLIDWARTDGDWTARWSNEGDITAPVPFAYVDLDIHLYGDGVSGTITSTKFPENFPQEFMLIEGQREAGNKISFKVYDYIGGVRKDFARMEAEALETEGIPTIRVKTLWQALPIFPTQFEPWRIGDSEMFEEEDSGVTPNNSFKPRPLRGLARVSLAGCGPA